MYNNQQVTRTQDTPTEKTPPTPAHTRARQDPQTNTSHKHLTTLNGGADKTRMRGEPEALLTLPVAHKDDLNERSAFKPLAVLGSQ